MLGAPVQAPVLGAPAAAPVQRATPVLKPYGFEPPPPGPLDAGGEQTVKEGDDDPRPGLPPIFRQDVPRDKSWVILYDRVYDVGGLSDWHPGGDLVLKEWLGRDATAAFDGSHPRGLLCCPQPGVVLVGELMPTQARMNTLRMFIKGGISIAGLLRYGKITLPEELRELLRGRTGVSDELIETALMAKKSFLPGLEDQVSRVAEPERIDKFRPPQARQQWEIDRLERWENQPAVTPQSCRAVRLARRREMLERLGEQAFLKLRGPSPPGGNAGHTGISFIDEQHEAIDRAFDRLREDPSADSMAALVVALDEHFFDEEQLLFGVGFPQECLTTHRSQHYSILTWVREQKLPLSDDFVDYCQRRFNLHSAQADDHYVRFIAFDDFDPKHAMRGGATPAVDGGLPGDANIIDRLLHMAGFLCCRTDRSRGVLLNHDTGYGPGI